MSNTVPDLSQLVSQVFQNQGESSSHYQSQAGGFDLADLFTRYVQPLLQSNPQWLTALQGTAIADMAGSALNQYAAISSRDVELANALGACTCWGENPNCHQCEGEGSPGWSLPETQAFKEYVQPAIETVRHELRARQQPALRTVNERGDI